MKKCGSSLLKKVAKVKQWMIFPVSLLFKNHDINVKLDETHRTLQVDAARNEQNIQWFRI